MEPYKSKFSLLQPLDKDLCIKIHTIPIELIELLQLELFNLGYKWAGSMQNIVNSDTILYYEILVLQTCKIISHQNYEMRTPSEKQEDIYYDFNQVFQPKPELTGFFASKRLGL